MKFINGIWHIKKEITPFYAVEYMGHKIIEKELILYVPVRHINDRADCIDLPMLTVRVSSPIENVIKISQCHFAGAVYKGPFVQISQESPQVFITETSDFITYQSGDLRAVIDKRPYSWKIQFYDDRRLLTTIGQKNMAYMINNETHRCYSVTEMSLDSDEYIYGLGERFTPFVKNGQVVSMWNEDGGTASNISYKNIPFHISNKGYGVFVDNEGDIEYEIGSEKVEDISICTQGERLDFYLISASTPKGVVSRYTELTGRPALPPAWSFGLWLTTSFTTSYDEETVTSFIEGMRKREIPLHVFHFDCYWMEALEWCNFTWDPKTFPNPKEMIHRYKNYGLKICVWINPYIAEKSPLFQDGVEKGVFLKKDDGSIFQTDFWQPGAAYVDFTNPEGVKWYQEKLKVLLDMGVDCFKTDFGERIPVRSVIYYDNSDPIKMHNYYTYLYNQAVFQLLVRERGEGDAVVFARSATASSQKMPVHWGGDCCASYAGMAETLRGGLSLASSGFSFWSHDIGGFENTATPDLYKRWCQFGMLSSHSRLHGSRSYRVPWLFDNEACDVLRKFVHLKCRLMPYLYAMALKSHKTGIPMMRPMFMEYTTDRTCLPLDQQYMLGDSLLIAPIFKETGEVIYYLPSGIWTNLLTEEIKQGGKWYKETFDYFNMPLYVKENSILTIGSCDSRPDYEYSKDVIFYISPFTDGAVSRAEIVNLQGEIELTAFAKRKGNVITFSIMGKYTDWEIRMQKGYVKRIEKEKNKAYIYLA